MTLNRLLVGCFHGAFIQKKMWSCLIKEPSLRDIRFVGNEVLGYNGQPFDLDKVCKAG